MRLRPHHQCFLEWHPWDGDQHKGLNHQLASLTCALSEAFFLNRTLLMPKHMCLFGLHTERWPGNHTSGDGRCVPMEEILDIELLSRLVPVLPVLPLDNQSMWGEYKSVQWAEYIRTLRTADAQPRWSSQRIAHTFPCRDGPALVRRRVGRPFWFSACTSGTTDAHAITREVHAQIGSGADAPLPFSSLLKSGIFYTRHIKRAAFAIRRKIGVNYAALHVRRSDKLTQCSLRDCQSRTTLTQPDAIAKALELWFPSGTHVYVGSTEKPDFFAPLRQKFNLHFAEDFASELAKVGNNYALYAVETLVAFGAAGYVDTFDYYQPWFRDACFPAAQLRGLSAQPLQHHSKGSRLSSNVSRSNVSRSVSVQVGYRGSRGILVNNVFFGAACVNNPPCGNAMKLIPKPLSSNCRGRSPSPLARRPARGESITKKFEASADSCEASFYALRAFL